MTNNLTFRAGGQGVLDGETSERGKLERQVDVFVTYTARTLNLTVEGWPLRQTFNSEKSGQRTS